MRAKSVVEMCAVLLAIATFLLVGAVVVIQNVNLDQVKEMLTTQVKNATGRTLTIAGPLELQVGIIPSVVAKGVTLSNPAGATRPEMIKIGQLMMEVAILPLIEREIQVRRLILSSPDILIETEVNGPGNLDFSTASTKSEPKKTESSFPIAQGENTAYRFTVSELKIMNGLVTWYDRTSQVTESVEIKELSLQPESAVEVRSALQLYSKIRDREIELSGTVGGLGALLSGKPWPINLKAVTEGLSVNMEGNIANMVGFSGVRLKIAAQGAELGDVIRLAGVSMPGLPHSMGPFKISANLTDDGKIFNLADVVIEAGKRDLFLLNGKGAVKDVMGKAAVDMALSMESDNPEVLTKLAGVQYSGKGPGKCTGKIRGSEKIWKMTELKALIGGSDLSGELDVHFAERPQFSGTLKSSNLSLADFSAPNVTASSASVIPVNQPAKGKEGDRRIFSDHLLPAASLRLADADLSVQVGELTYEDRQLTNIAVVLQLTDGRLVVKPFRFGLAGGIVEGEASLDAAEKIPTAALRLDGRQIDLGKLDNNGPITGGKSDLRVGLKSRGNSVRAMMASATGETSLRVGKGWLQNRAVEFAGGDPLFQLLGTLNPFAKSEDTTQMTCAAVRFIIRDGIATADKGIAMRTSKVDVVGSGTVDLRTESLDLFIKPRVRSGVEVSLSSELADLVKVGGSLGKPSIGIDTAGTLRTAATIGAGVATGGLSVLGEMLVDKAIVDNDPCRTALGQAQQDHGQQKTAPKTQGSGDILQGLFGR